jgi:hypothetical protein
VNMPCLDSTSCPIRVKAKNRVDLTGGRVSEIVDAHTSLAHLTALQLRAILPHGNALNELWIYTL